MALRTAWEALAVKCVVKLTTLRWIREQCRNGAGEQVPAQFQFFFAEAVGEEAEVADALSRNCSSLTPESPAVVLLFGVFGLRQRDEGLIVSQFGNTSDFRQGGLFRIEFGGSLDLALAGVRYGNQGESFGFGF